MFRLFRESWLFKYGLIAFGAGLMFLYMGASGDVAAPFNQLKSQQGTVETATKVTKSIRQRGGTHEWYELASTVDGAKTTWKIDADAISEDNIREIVEEPVQVWIAPDSDNEIYQIKHGDQMILRYDDILKYHGDKSKFDMLAAPALLVLGAAGMLIGVLWRRKAATCAVAGAA